MSESTSVRYPDGENPAMTDLADQLGTLMGQGLDHVLLYDQDTAKVALSDADGTGGETSAAHERTGRMLYYILRELEPDFAGLRTGALIRTVLRLPDGAVFYYMVEPGIHLYGATGDVGRIEALDATIADSVNTLRTAVRYSTLDFGSYSSMRAAAARGRDASAAAAVTAAEEPDADASEDTGTDEDACGTGAGHDGDRDGRGIGRDTEVATVLRRALHPEGLHYLAYYRARSESDSVDIFERPGLRRFFRVASFEQRRDRYRRLGALLPGVMRRMNQSLGAVMHGELVRVVLDVEQGAVYFHALPGSRFLIGVTLDQSRVAVSDEQMARTAKELEGIEGISEGAVSGTAP